MSKRSKITIEIKYVELLNSGMLMFIYLALFSWLLWRVGARLDLSFLIWVSLATAGFIVNAIYKINKIKQEVLGEELDNAEQIINELTQQRDKVLEIAERNKSMLEQDLAREREGVASLLTELSKKKDEVTTKELDLQRKLSHSKTELERTRLDLAKTEKELSGKLTRTKLELDKALKENQQKTNEIASLNHKVKQWEGEIRKKEIHKLRQRRSALMNKENYKEADKVTSILVNDYGVEL